MFFYNEGVVESIHCRLDLRSLSKKLLEQILGYIEEIGRLMVYDDKVFTQDIVKIVELMKCSKANRFCKNPIGYIDEISKNGLI